MKKFISTFLLLFVFAFLFSQECSDLFISEYVEGTGNNKAIELYNPTTAAIDLSAYNLVRYSNGGFEPYSVGLSGTIQPKSTFVVVLDKRDPNGVDLEQPVDPALQEKADLFLCPVYSVNRMMYFNGNDAVTLEKLTGEIVDIFAIIGGGMLADDNGWGSLNDTLITYNSGGNPTEYFIQNYIVGPLFWLSWTENQTLIRHPDVTAGVKSNPNPYFEVFVQWDSIPVNTFDSLGSHTCDCNYLGVDENIANLNIHVYPNPVVNGMFSITADEKIEFVEIFDITGKLVEIFELDGNSEQVNLKLSETIKGIYLSKITFATGQVQTKKMLFK
ncbi:MAG TPA: lamin tail domain-containing protein [Bacteroidales bacterium]